jgi:hypothetical protein
VLNAPINRFGLVVKDEVCVGTNFAGSGKQKTTAIKVKRITIGGTDIPSEAYLHFLHARRFFGQIDVPTLLQTDCHLNLLFNARYWRY